LAGLVIVAEHFDDFAQLRLESVSGRRKPEHGAMNTGGGFLSTDKTNSIGENAWELEKYVEYAQKDRNAWHVDLVAHSMGGLISRYYISQL
jgi:hypothetical protein